MTDASGGRVGSPEMLRARRRSVVGRADALRLLKRAMSPQPRLGAPTSAGVAARSPPGGRLRARSLPSSLGVSSFDSFTRAASNRLERLPMELIVAVGVG